MKKVKYEVLSFFGTASVGDIVTGYMVEDEGDGALLYFPRDKHGDACFILCKPTESGTYVERDSESWVNISNCTGFSLRLQKFLNSEIKRSKEIRS